MSVGLPPPRSPDSIAAPKAPAVALLTFGVYLAGARDYLLILGDDTDYMLRWFGPGARKAVESSQRLGRHRWVVEACLSWLQRNRRLARRYERKAEHFHAFADLGCALLTYRRLTKRAK